MANPFGTGRLFRTGDIGCWDSNGDLEFHGRGDGQVKIRGHRVETVGVEAALRTLPGVDTAVVVARPDPTGSLTLWAYVTGDGGPTRQRCAQAGRATARLSDSRGRGPRRTADATQRQGRPALAAGPRDAHRDGGVPAAGDGYRKHDRRAVR